jgi:acetyl esterase/lipase
VIVFILAILVVTGTALCVWTPYPAVYFVRWLFGRYPYTPPDDYATYLENVIVQRDIDYHSAFPNGTFTIIKPKNCTGKEKVIFAVHGGGFVSEGDETDFYYVLLANSGFVTVNIQYAIAPEQGKYPSPVKQLEEAYRFITENNAEYQLNLDHVFFSGDSAGGQIAGQFTALQTNPQYLDLMNGLTPVQFKQLVPSGTIDGVILFCAIYDFLQLDPPPENTMKLPLVQIGQAYFGTRNIHDKRIESAGILDKVTSDFPRAFITDANTYSFDFEAKEMVQILESKNIPVTPVFYDKTEAALKHNYQFHMNTSYAQQTYQKLVEFLNGAPAK